jgi:hypothetical protein
MARVLKPGGKLVVTDFDPASIVISPIDSTLQKISMDIYMPSFADPLIGRRLPQLFKQAGIKNIDTSIDISYEKNFSQLEKIIPMKKVLDGGVRANFPSKNQANQWPADLRLSSAESGFPLYPSQLKRRD